MVALRNEFAHVDVGLHATGNGPRLRITDVKTGASVLLDPLELERLAWASHKQLGCLLDPGHSWDTEGWE